MAKDIKPPDIEIPEGVVDWVSWIKNNATSLSAADVEKVKKWTAENPGVLGSDFDATLASVEKGQQQEAAKALGQDLSAGKPPAADLNGDGYVSQAETKARAETPKIARQQAEKAATQQGATPEEAKAAGDAAEKGLTGLITAKQPVPPALQPYLSDPSGRPTYEQSQKMIEAWNLYHPMEPITNEDELFKKLSVGGTQNPATVQVIEAGILGSEPLIDYKIPTLDGQSYTVPAATFDLLANKYGYTSMEMTSAVRSAARAGLTDGRGEPAWQVLLGLANATRQRNALTPLDGPDRSNEEAAQRDLQQSIDARRYAGRTGGTQSEWQSRANPRLAGSGSAGPLARRNSERFYNNAAGVATASLNYASAQSLTNLAVQFKSGQSLYGGDDVLALVYVVDPSLAARLSTTKSKDLSIDDKRKLLEIGSDMGFSDDDLAALGYGWITNQVGSGGIDGGGGGGGSGAVRNLPDPVAVRQAAKDLYKSLYVAEPPESVLDQLVASVTNAITSAPDDQTIDPNARLRQAAQSLPEYSELYGRMPGGQDEATYRAQFEQAAGSILGSAAADPSIVQGGMRTGSTQTAVGSAAASKKAWESSSWFARLAAAAQTLSENT